MNPLPAAEPPSHSTGHTDPQSNDASVTIDAQLLESLTKQIQESQHLSHGQGMRLDPGEEEILDTAQEVISQILSSDQSQTLLSLLQHSGKGSDLDHEMHHHHQEELTLEQQQQQQQTLQETLSLLLLKDQQSQQQMHVHHHELVEEDEQERLSSAVHAAVAALQEGLAGSGQDLSATQSMIASSIAPGGDIVDPNLPAAALYQSLVLQLCQAALQTSSMEQSAQSDTSPAFWASALNAMTSSNLVTPPISTPSSPTHDSDDFVIVTKNPKSHLPADKHRRRKMGPDGPMMEQMSEEATEQEQQMLHEAIANAVTVSDPESFKREMRYECPACRRPFTRLYNLKSHIRSHQNYRPFKCSQCTASFTRNHDLNRHERTHDNAKPYACKYCGKHFARKDALRRHERMDPQGKKTHCVVDQPLPLDHPDHPDNHSHSGMGLAGDVNTSVFHDISPGEMEQHWRQLQELKEHMESLESLEAVVVMPPKRKLQV